MTAAAAIAARVAAAYDQAGKLAGDGVGAVVITIVRPAAPTGPKWSPTPAGVPVTHTFKALPSDAAYTRLTGTALTEKERAYSLANSGVTIAPLVSDVLTIYGVEWPVVEVIPMDAAGGVITWMVKVAK